MSVAYQEMLLVELGGLKKIIKEKWTHFKTRRRVIYNEKKLKILAKKDAEKALIEAYLMHLNSFRNWISKWNRKKTYKLAQTREKKSNNLGI